MNFSGRALLVVGLVRVMIYTVHACLVLLPIVSTERFSDSYNLMAQSRQQCVPHLPGFGWS
jgi:hypothetical protein